MEQEKKVHGKDTDELKQEVYYASPYNWFTVFCKDEYISIPLREASAFTIPL